MMVDGISLNSVNSVDFSVRQRGQTPSHGNFMEALGNKLAEAKGKLKEVPGMPGIYSPQSLDSLNVVDISNSSAA